MSMRDEEELFDQFWRETESHDDRIYVAMTAISKRNSACRKCGHPTGYLARYNQANSHTAVRWVCANCDDYYTKGDLPHEFVFRFVARIDDLPIRIDRRDPNYRPPPVPPCIVCGEDGRHNHHWAPRAIFPDWPDGEDFTVQLCEGCHTELHKRLRAHGLRWPHELLAR